MGRKRTLQTSSTKRPRSAAGPFLFDLTAVFDSGLGKGSRHGHFALTMLAHG
jgi:hypothetical protein